MFGDSTGEGETLKTILALAVVAVSLATVGVFAQERSGDAALGALSGAVVLGPVGAVAGAIVGYTAGPSIARSWGLRHSEPRYKQRATKRSTTTSSNKAALKQGASAHGVALQAASTPGSATQQRATQAAVTVISAPPPRSPAGTIGAPNAPLVQGFE